MLYNDILETIGNTPVVRLSKLAAKHGIKGNIYAKVEFYSPGMSKKDRIAKYMIERAEQSGCLKKGQTVIEQTSGNTGIGLAAVCAFKGYPFIAVMSAGNSPERAQMIHQFGAKVVLVPQSPNSTKGSVNAKDMELVEAEFNRLANKLNALKVGQFYNEDNAMTHYHTTANEIIDDLPDVDAFADFIGTGGSFEGIARRLKEYATTTNRDIECFIVEPANNPHIIQGGGYLRPIPFADPANCDGKITITNDEAIFWTKELLTVEAIAGGISSGANLAACVKYLKTNPGKDIVFLVNDPVLKYLSAECLK